MSASSHELGVNRDGFSTTQHNAAVEERQPVLGEENLSNQCKHDDGVKDGGRERSTTQPNLRDGETGSTINVNGDGARPTTEAFSPSQTAVPTTLMTRADRQGPPPWPGEALDMYRRIAKLQHKFFGAHIRLNSERDAVKPRLDNLNESLSRLGHLLEQLANRKSTGSDDNLWTYACGQFTAGRQSFEDQIQVVDDQEQRLGKLLYKLAKLEPEFLQVVDAYFKSGQHIQLDASTTTSSHSHSPSRTLDPLEQQYYNKRGDVRLLRERLINHRADFQVSSSEQPTLPASSAEGQYVQSAAFQKWWETEHENILEELSSAEKQMELLWSQCQDAQFDVGELETEQPKAADTFAQAQELERRESNLIEFNTPSFLPHDRHGVLPDFLREIRWSKQGERIAPFIEELARFTGKREFIEDWVGKIPLGQGVPPGPVEFQHEISSPRSEPEWAYVNWTGDDVGLTTDYVIVPNDGELAPNGDALEPRQPGLVQRVLRRFMSDGALDARFRQLSKPSSRGSRQIHRSPHPQ